MNGQHCPGCPECQPSAGPNVTLPDLSSRNPLTKDEFGRLLAASYTRYLRLPDHERETFDAASYVAGLEHGYREACVHPESPKKQANFAVLCLFAMAIMFIAGLILGVALP